MYHNLRESSARRIADARIVHVVPRKPHVPALHEITAMLSQRVNEPKIGLFERIAVSHQSGSAVAMESMPNRKGF